MLGLIAEAFVILVRCQIVLPSSHKPLELDLIILDPRLFQCLAESEEDSHHINHLMPPTRLSCQSKNQAQVQENEGKSDLLYQFQVNTPVAH